MKICPKCGKEFATINKFCSIQCAKPSFGWRRGRIFTKYKVKCRVCGKSFTTVPSSKKQKTCSRKCLSQLPKKYPQKKQCPKCGKEFFARRKGHNYCSRGCNSRRRKPTIRDIRPNLLKLQNYSCQKCNWNKKKEILEIHHKDGNPKNNSFHNLIVLCPNCHEMKHFLNHTGRHHQRYL